MKTFHPLVALAVLCAAIFTVAFLLLPSKPAGAAQAGSDLPWFAKRGFRATFANGDSVEVLSIEARAIIDSDIWWWRVQIKEGGTNKLAYINPQQLQRLDIPEKDEAQR
jgi:hypothetical protein